MKNRSHRILRSLLFAWMGWVSLVWLAGCAMYQYPGYNQPQVPVNSSPTLGNLTVAPNPTCPGSIVNLTVAYTDMNGDLEYGMAAVSVNGSELSRIAFRATYTSGVLTIPVPVSFYTRAADLPIALQIRDSAGNWSNVATTVLSIR